MFENVWELNNDNNFDWQNWELSNIGEFKMNKNTTKLLLYVLNKDLETPWTKAVKLECTGFELPFSHLIWHVKR